MVYLYIHEASLTYTISIIIRIACKGIAKGHFAAPLILDVLKTLMCDADSCGGSDCGCEDESGLPQGDTITRHSCQDMEKTGPMLTARNRYELLRIRDLTTLELIVEDAGNTLVYFARKLFFTAPSGTNCKGPPQSIAIDLIILKKNGNSVG
ncbi:hypothetical protein PABG_11915 [Paracoccidioides brasiliensis Pb03]|nr:hypothetical protein PABG_11915 [Paracoccidioides brasiliensis Pb03]